MKIYEFVNRIIPGDCIEVMRQMPDRSVDFIATDPPYLVNYEDRSGRRVANDDRDGWLAPAFAQMYRVLKYNRFAVSFYGWNKVPCTRRFTDWKPRAGSKRNGVPRKTIGRRDSTN